MLTYSNSVEKYSILNQLNLSVEFSYNPYGFVPSDLFEMGARMNPKRSFLFVSKLIGKHLDVQPNIPKATGHLLADLFIRETEGNSVKDTSSLVNFVKNGEISEHIISLLNKRHTLNKSTLFIGFAETATGLGHSVFSAFDNTHYVHTTREEISDIKSVFDFEEEHSHATDHRCYLKNGDLMESAEHIVLVDDEITTGKTSINLIRALHQVYPKKEFSVLALLDWRNEEQQAAFVALEKELGAKIRVISLTRGNMQVTKEAFFTDNKERFEIKPASYEVISQKMAPFVQVLDIKKNAVSYPMYTGRFGLSSDMHDEIEEASQKIGEEIQSLRSGKRTLVLGTGEFMYIPSRIASYCGDGITHKTTTRSPIFPVNNDNYPIRERIQYVDDHGVNYFAYNLESNQYDDVFILSEKTMSKRMLEEISSEMNRCGIQKVSFIYV